MWIWVRKLLDARSGNELNNDQLLAKQRTVLSLEGYM
jgi:hypothetical protein